MQSWIMLRSDNHFFFVYIELGFQWNLVDSMNVIVQFKTRKNLITFIIIIKFDQEEKQIYI